MTYSFLDIAGTPSVKAAQEAMGVGGMWEVMGQEREFDRFTPNEGAFIAERDSFYMATVTETGWPYVQHRGGPKGFVKMLDDQTLAFADYAGNRQYISLGNLGAGDRASVIMVDYPRRARLKLLGHMEVVGLDDEPALTERVLDAGYRARPERILRFRLAAFDWNCPQHITPRFTQDDIEIAVAPLRQKVALLEAENARLREAASHMLG